MRIGRFTAIAVEKIPYLHVEIGIIIVGLKVIVVNVWGCGLNGKIEQWKEKWKSGLLITKHSQLNGRDFVALFIVGDGAEDSIKAH